MLQIAKKQSYIISRVITFAGTIKLTNMAVSCASQCVTYIPPSSSENCGTNLWRGGLGYQVFATCDITAELLADGVDPVTNKVVPSVWQPYLDACKIRISPVQGEGSLETAGTNEQQIYACRLPQPTAYTHTFTFIQRNRTISALDARFYRHISDNQNHLQVGFIACHEELFIPFLPFTLVSTSPIEATRSGLWTLNNVFSIETSYSIIEPVQVKGLASLLLGNATFDCNTGGYAYDSFLGTYIEDLFG